MDLVEAQRLVLEWATSGDSFDKMGFFKAFAQGFGLKEVHVAKGILANIRQRPENRKRSWVGPTPEERKRRLITIEDPKPKFSPAPLLPRSFVPRCEGAWWKEGNRKKADVLGYDAEHVHLKGISGVSRIRAGIVSVVKSNFEVEYFEKVYHKPGTFLDDYIIRKKSGINANSLKNGKAMAEVNMKLHETFQNKLIIVCGGDVDFSCVDLAMSEYVTFDLQAFYRRTKEDDGTTHGMSLRDIYFLEFNQDMQGIRSHSAEEDARATIKIFLDGYCKRMKDNPENTNRHYYALFDNAIKMKKMDDQKKYFCNSDKKFKTTKCNCNECFRLFYRKM